MSKKVEVDDEIFDILSERSGEKGFDTTDEYVNYVLGQVADKITRKKSEDEDEDSGFSEEDEKKVKDRLRSLGYLD